MEALKRAVKLAGSQAALAAAVNALRADDEKVGQTAISNWIQRGGVPPDNVIHVARAVKFAVTPHELSPDLYPHPEDGLPQEMRAGQGALFETTDAAGERRIESAAPYAPQPAAQAAT